MTPQQEEGGVSRQPTTVTWTQPRCATCQRFVDPEEAGELIHDDEYGEHREVEWLCERCAA
jgi:hypothetical protein